MNAVIEIPKGSNRRIHFSKETQSFVDFGSIQEKIPVNNGIMPLAYGFIENTLNKTEGDEIDVLVLSQKDLRTGDVVKIHPIALLLREDHDDKIIATDETTVNVYAWEDIDIKLQTLLIQYFGHNHKITSVQNSQSAQKYIRENNTP